MSESNSAFPFPGVEGGDTLDINVIFGSNDPVSYMAVHNGPVSNAFVVNDLRIMAWAAQYMGEQENAARYAAQLEKSRTAYLATFVNDDGTMKDDCHGAYVMALQFVIPQGKLLDKVLTKLVQKLRDEGMQTGFFATQHLLPFHIPHVQLHKVYWRRF